jgi:hypothetical protein
MPMSEAEVMTNSILLDEHETTGPLPVGFEFERQGARYDHFDVSSEGFITFVRGTSRPSRPGRVRLVEERTRFGGGRVAYGVRGIAPRRRLVVSLTEDGRFSATFQVTVHERTGIVEVGSGGQSFGEPTIRQLDMVHFSPSRANSARKMG